MKDFASIDLASLSLVTGGADNQQPQPQSPNSDNLQVGAQANIPRVGPVNLGVNAGRNRSDYGYCADTVKSMGGNAQDLRNTCGLPGGGQ